MTTIRQAELAASNVIDRFEARLLLAFCLKVNRTYLITHDKDELPEATLNQYKDLVQKRAMGMPVPYICGTQEFYGRPFKVTQDVLIPRPDTETLIDFILEECSKESPMSLLDMGTGSGCIAITLALENPRFTVSATDISDKALNVAKQNAKQLKAPVTFYEGSWFDALPASSQFDVIVSNPPYIHKDDAHLANLKYEPINALTDGFNGLSNIAHIIDRAPDHLKQGGLLAFEHGWDQGGAVRDLFNQKNSWRNVRTIKDLGGNNRVTAAYLL